ncbi:MAG TPA: class II glutamine amidotransferase [Acetobacteraceae bacterium]|nr:class II glutamine amidotransferase [Acetobacteraceae bacterium]
MCRFLAYHGEPILLEELIASPSHSLIKQSQHAAEGKTETNGDGFGVGWYGERPEPGLYRELRPAWSDENLWSICAQVRSKLFFAHVRAATGTATTRANCHPFALGRFMFMHNGQIGGYRTIRRRIEALVPDELYHVRTGTTDTEAIFLAAASRGLAADPVAAISATLALVLEEMWRAGVTAALRFTAALTDGDGIWAFRWASDSAPPTLYYRQGDSGVIVVSEPIDDDREDWHAVPAGHALVAAHGARAVLRRMEPTVALAA